MMKITVHAERKSKFKIGSHVVLGVVEFDLVKFLGQKQMQVDMELTKTKVAKSYLQFKISVVGPQEAGNVLIRAESLNERKKSLQLNNKDLVDFSSDSEQEISDGEKGEISSQYF